MSGEIYGNGSTCVNAGTLALAGSLPGITSSNINAGPGGDPGCVRIAPFLLTGQNLLGSGTNKGAVTADANSAIYAGLDGTYGTNTFNNSLTLSGGATAHFDLGVKANQSNDLIVVGAGGTSTLTLNGNQIHIKAPSTAVGLDTADYTLFQVNGTISGTRAARRFGMSSRPIPTTSAS